MILVTVGMHNKPFDRLVKAADALAAEIDEKVIIQRGVSNYEPRHAEHFRFVGQAEMEELIRQARVVITQPGAGTILAAARQGKLLVLVPRARRHKEVLDDHQMELAAALMARNTATAVLNPTPEALQTAIEDARSNVLLPDRRESLLRAVREHLATWDRLLAQGTADANEAG